MERTAPCVMLFGLQDANAPVKAVMTAMRKISWSRMCFTTDITGPQTTIEVNMANAMVVCPRVSCILRHTMGTYR